MYNVHSFHPWLDGCCHNCGTPHLDSPTKLIDSQSFEHLSYDLVGSALIWFMQSDKAINGLIQSVSYLHIPKLVVGLLHVGRDVTLHVADIWLSLDPPVSILDGCVSVLAHLQILRPHIIIVTKPEWYNTTCLLQMGEPWPSPASPWTAWRARCRPPWACTAWASVPSRWSLVSDPTRWSFLFISGFLYGSSPSKQQRNIVQLCTIFAHDKFSLEYAA